MRPLHLLLYTILTAIPASAFGSTPGHEGESPDTITGVKWRELSLASALEAAGQEGKLVFVDCYTKTCGPCRMMVNKIFPRRECGDHINPRYVPIMMDMEEGEGPVTAETYGVGIYPTYLALYPDGSTYFRLEGGASKTPALFLNKLRTVEHLAELEKRYQSGDRTPGLMHDFISALKPSQSGRCIQILSEYLMPMPLDSIARPENWVLIKKCLTTSVVPLFERLLEGRDTLARSLGVAEVQATLVNVYATELSERQNMKLQFDARIPGLTLLADEGCVDATTIKYGMIFRNIINHGYTRNYGEVIDILSTLPSELPSKDERSLLVGYLTGIDRVTPSSHRGKMADAVERAFSDVPATAAHIRDNITSRLRR